MNKRDSHLEIRGGTIKHFLSLNQKYYIYIILLNKNKISDTIACNMLRVYEVLTVLN